MATLLNARGLPVVGPLQFQAVPPAGPRSRASGQYGSERVHANGRVGRGTCHRAPRNRRSSAAWLRSRAERSEGSQAV